MKSSCSSSIAIRLVVVTAALALVTWASATARVPEWLGLALLAALGMMAGGVVNRWTSVLESRVAPPACRAIDWVPLLGSLTPPRDPSGRRHGWLRAVVVEILMGGIAVALYLWEVRDEGLLPAVAMFGAPPANQFASANLLAARCSAFVAQMVLVVLMATASLVDADEQIIPDEITVSGTLIGLIWAAAWPWSLPSAMAWVDGVGNRQINFVHLAAPNDWPAALGSWPGLLLALACFWAWCLALAPWRWYGRHGMARAFAIVTARTVRDVMTRIGIVGTLAIPLVWFFAPAAHWAGLLSALVGMAAGGAIVWGVRIVGSSVLRQEAMGFGDVTLLAMIGAFLGWQACPLVFFLAPLAGVVIGVGQWLLNRRHEISYGPFLCLAALVVIVFWQTMWREASLAYMFGWLVPAGLAGCIVLLGVMLRFWLWFRWAILRRD